MTIRIKGHNLIKIFSFAPYFIDVSFICCTFPAIEFQVWEARLALLVDIITYICAIRISATKFIVVINHLAIILIADERPAIIPQSLMRCIVVIVKRPGIRKHCIGIMVSILCSEIQILFIIVCVLMPTIMQSVACRFIKRCMILPRSPGCIQRDVFYNSIFRECKQVRGLRSIILVLRVYGSLFRSEPAKEYISFFVRMLLRLCRLESSFPGNRRRACSFPMPSQIKAYSYQFCCRP